MYNCIHYYSLLGHPLFKKNHFKNNTLKLICSTWELFIHKTEWKNDLLHFQKTAINPLEYSGCFWEFDMCNINVVSYQITGNAAFLTFCVVAGGTEIR